MSRRMNSTTRTTVAAMTAVVIAVAVVLAQPGGSAKARADSSGPTAPTAPTAPDCCPHTHARAQAVVKANGTALRSTGVTATVLVATGTYCIQLNATTPVVSTAPVVSQDLSLEGSPTATPVSVAIASSAPDCTQLPNSVEVMTFTSDGAQRAPADEGFSVVVS